MKWKTCSVEAGGRISKSWFFLSLIRRRDTDPEQDRGGKTGLPHIVGVLGSFPYGVSGSASTLADTALRFRQWDAQTPVDDVRAGLL